MDPKAFWQSLEAAEKARIEAVRIKARGNHLAAQNDEPERRCYVCGASMSDPCQAVDGQIAECPRPSRPVPTKRAKRCPSGRSEHQMEPEWKGRSYSHMKCRWCNHREAV